MRIVRKIRVVTKNDDRPAPLSTGKADFEIPLFGAAQLQGGAFHTCQKHLSQLSKGVLLSPTLEDQINSLPWRSIT